MSAVRAAQLRAELAKNRGRSKQANYPAEARRLAVEYARDRRAEGASFAQIAAEIGLNDVTMRNRISNAQMRGGAGATPPVRENEVSLLPVVVRSGQDAVGAARLDVVFPDGTRLGVTGIGGRDLVEAIDALRRPR